MKDEGGDKIVIGCKMKTVCDSVIVGNPEKTPSVDMLFSHRSIAARMSWPTVMVIGNVKRGPGKGKRVTVPVTAGWATFSQGMLKGQRQAVKQRIKEMCRAKVIPQAEMSEEERRIFGFDPGTGETNLATVRK